MRCGGGVTIILVTYMNPTEILNQIAQVQFMDRGKLSTYTFKKRAQPATPYFKLQSWEQGRNLTRYIRPEQVPLVREALAAHEEFKALVEQYAQLVIDRSRKQIEGVGVKKKPGRRPSSSSPKSRKSSN